MTRTKLKFFAALLAACLLTSLSVAALSDDEEPAESSAVDEIDIEEIHAQVERALGAVPWEEINRQLADVRAAAMADLDVEEIHAEVRAALDDVDWDEIRRDIEAAQAEVKTMDLEGVRAEVLEALEGVDWDEIRQTLEDAQGIAAEELQALDGLLEELAADGSGVI